jgi:cbb3-type cytochrome oxidase subunit 1
LARFYYILPRVAAIDACPKAMRAHFWLNVVGVVLLGLPLVAGGASQGTKLLNATIPFLEVAKSTLMTLRVSTFGLVLILIGNLVFLFNVSAVLVRYYRTVCQTAYKTATALEPAGVKP